MSKQKFSIHSPEGRKLVIFCVFALLFSATVLTLTLDVDLSALIPSQEKLDNLRREEKQAIAAWKLVEAKQQAFDKVEKEYQSLLDSAWREDVNGSPDVEITKLLNGIAKKHNLELTGVSAVRRSRINNDLTGLETDVNTAATLAQLTAFWQEIRAQKPPFAWKRMDLRPETVQNSDRVIFSGTLRMLLRENAAKNGKGGVK